MIWPFLFWEYLLGSLKESVFSTSATWIFIQVHQVHQAHLSHLLNFYAKRRWMNSTSRWPHETIWQRLLSVKSRTDQFCFLIYKFSLEKMLYKVIFFRTRPYWFFFGPAEDAKRCSFTRRATRRIRYTVYPIYELEILFQFTFAPAFLTAAPMIPLNIGINFADIYLLYMIYHVWHLGQTTCQMGNSHDNDNMLWF